MEQILIVEDDTDINNMVASALTKAGYECKQSFSGTEAMLYLNKEKFSVIILDLMLPGKSGNSIVEEIKPYLDTSIIVVSAKDELDTKVNLLFSGADDYITKPFEIDELVARVAVQIRKHSTDKTESVYHYKDIRTPLTSMDGYFQLLLKSDDPEERQQYAAVISDRLFSLKEMLDELFTYAKLTNKAYEIELSPCAVNEILLSVLFSFYKDIKQKAIEPFIDVPEQDVFIQGNEPALRRIFQNILKNCIEHGNKHLYVRLINNTDTIQISFENDYQAHEPIEASKVFDRFYKADEARSTTSTGLGLSIAKELVERLNGFITGNVMNDTFTVSITFQIQK